MAVTLDPVRIQAWIQKHFPDHKSRKNGDEIVINNPFNGDTGYHMSINIPKACVHDWRGDDWVGFNRLGQLNKRTFLKFVQLYRKCSYHDAVREVIGSANAELYLIKARRQKQEQETTATGIDFPPGTSKLNNDKWSNAIRRYLASRMIDDELIERYQLRYSGFDVVYPYYEYDELVYWQARSILNKRFLFPPASIGATKGDFLFGFDQVEPASYLIITEAIIDCITIGDQCVASGGAILVPTQIKKIKLLGPRQGIILAPDNDPPGIKSLASNVALLKILGVDIKFSLPPKLPKLSNPNEYTKDWNDVAKETSREKARKYFEDGVRPYDIRARLQLRKELEV